VIQAARVPQSNRVCCGKQSEVGVGRDDLVLVKQRKAAIEFEHALNHEHDVGPTRVILVEGQSYGMLQRPRQNAFLEFGHLQSVLEHDRITANQINPADMCIEVHSDARPIETRRDLLNMRRLASPVIALDHHPTVVRKASQDRQCCVGIENIAFVKIGHMLFVFCKRRHLPVNVDTKSIADIHHRVRSRESAQRVRIEFRISHIVHRGHDLDEHGPARNARLLRGGENSGPSISSLIQAI